MSDVVPRFSIDGTRERINLKNQANNNRVIVDFGCGMGDATIALLDQEPDSVVLAIDVHTPGICRVAEYADEHSKENLRVFHGDGFIVIEDWLESHSVDVFLVLFPDPWPKVRHHKRRLVQESFFATAHRLLADNGQLVIATDDASYAAHITETIAKTKLFTREEINFDIPSTGFARRGTKLGNTSEIFTLSPSKYSSFQ
jgi:tRNA (guanine-N7-)-methyltransferase